MRLAEFIIAEREQILLEWDAFARSCLPVSHRMNLTTLRDHAGEILETIAEDLNDPQSRAQQVAKSVGRSDARADSRDPDTAAQSHGNDRAYSGFDVMQMVSEFRALRASVIRLWIANSGELGVEDIEDLMRFNEAIDQALAESTARHAQRIESSKEMFIAMLGHDLRTPLGAIIASAQAIASSRATPETMLKGASIILSSGRRMNSLVSDLLDFTRSRLGDGIPVVCAEADLEAVCRQTVEEIVALHPGRDIKFATSGSVRGKWDAARISQALSNLISNAVQHGGAAGSIDVTLRGEVDEAVLSVQNRGSLIEPDQLNKIFDPLHRGADEGEAGGHNLGLGLYITERIVASHGGKIAVESTEDTGTIFTIRLPKRRRGDGVQLDQ
jgi:signal transduction histidine kinase